MPGSGIPRLARLLGRVALAYIVVFALWLIAAGQYHLLLGKAAGTLIPVVARSNVERVWYADGGMRYRIKFESRDAGIRLLPGQTVEAVMQVVVDIHQFGYPMVTFLALAIGIHGPPPRKRILLTILGAAILFGIYALWVLVEVYQYLSVQELPFLRHNLIARLISPHFYAANRIGFYVFLGQVLPIAVWALLFLRSFRKTRSAATKIEAVRVGIESHHATAKS